MLIEPSMPNSDIFLKYLINHAPLLVIKLSNDGFILEINRYAREILGDLEKSQRINDLIVDFNHSFDLKKMAANPETKQILSIQTQSKLPKSFHFQFYPEDEFVMAFGHIDILDNEILQTELISITQELSNTTRTLHKKNAELQDALDHVKTLQGILPICSYCQKIRNDDQVWDRMEKYLSDHTDVQLSHGVCPECMKKHYPKYCDD